MKLERSRSITSPKIQEQVPLQAREATPERCTFRYSLRPLRSSKSRFNDSHGFIQLPPPYPNGTLILAIPGPRSSLFCTRFGHLVCLASVACQTFFRRRRPFCAIAPPQANRCEALETRIAWTTARPGLLHERPFKMKRAWSNASEWPPVEKRRC